MVVLVVIQKGGSSQRASVRVSECDKCSASKLLMGPLFPIHYTGNGLMYMENYNNYPHK